MYEGQLWAELATSVKKQSIRIKYFEKEPMHGSIWKWPEKVDEKVYSIDDIHPEIQTSDDII